jgi:formate dehydrogenase subunit gamma
MDDARIKPLARRMNRRTRAWPPAEDCGLAMDSSETWNKDAVAAIVDSLRHAPGALLRILRRVQDDLGWIPPPALPLIAHGLNLSRAEVHGVASFYHDFRHTPPARNVIRLCRAESCQALGAEALARHVRGRLGVGFGETTSDREFALEAVYCLGNCACSPAGVINGQLLGRLTPKTFDDALESLVRR